MKRSVKSIRGWMAAPVLLTAASLALIAPGARAADDAGAQLGPQELVTKVAQDTLKDLDSHRAEYKQNPKRVRELVDKNMLPHFDTTYAAQLVLAKYWRTATTEQRKRFVDAFYQSLLQNYGDALLEFTPDRLKILPFQGKPDDQVATVRSEVRRDNGQRVPVNYSLRKTADGSWKAYDVQIEGVSYVKSFRTDFGSEIQQKGLEPVIQRLEQQVASGTVQKPTATPAGSQQNASEKKS
jgi:phospholipid transport system substrate-binding protein